MPLDPIVIAVLAAIVGLALGFLIGRRTGSSARRLAELQGRIEELSKEREFLQAEVSVAKDAAKQLREDHEGYRAQVANHFSGTSELLRDMTRQYRAVYEHLTQGAGALCPDGFVGLEPGSGPDALPSGPSAFAPADEERDDEPRDDEAPDDEGPDGDRAATTRKSGANPAE